VIPAIAIARQTLKTKFEYMFSHVMYVVNANGEWGMGKGKNKIHFSLFKREISCLP
jgi:hypothetical protein